MGEIGGKPKTVRTSFTKLSRNCHDETSQNIRKKMLILPQKYYICSVNNKHNPTHSIQGIGLPSADEFGLCFLKTYKIMRTMKSVLIVTRMGYIEGVFTSFRALANSRGATRINIEGEYEPYTETELKDIAVNGQTFTYFGKKCRISARTLNI